MPDLKRVKLFGTSIETTAIGFGCNNLFEGKTRQQGLQLLETAYDMGIRHFDVARYYGFGDAEGLLGEFARGKRDKITITTKFGLQPQKQVAKYKKAINLVRKLMRLSPFVRNVVRKQASAVVQKGRFDVASAQSSLETSLKELQTDYIDIYLLHECQPQDCQPELLAFLEKSRQEGKIRSFGTGAGLSNTEAVCREVPSFTEITQFQNSILSLNIRKISFTDERLEKGQRAILTHGSLSALMPLMERIQQDPDFAQRFSSEFGLDSSQTTAIAGLLLQHAMSINPNGIVLFRSASPNRVMANIQAADQITLNQQQLATLEAMGEEVAQGNL